VTKRLALLIGNSVFDDIGNFPKLRTPVNDAQDLAVVLEKHCDFEVLGTLMDADADTMRRAVEHLYHQAQRGDLTLLYYSGHGYKDRDARLYLAARNTQSDSILSTGVQESFIHDAMRLSNSRHRIVILDCCFSGAFVKGRKGSDKPILFEELKGEATAILASSGAIQHSFEEDGRNSLFTQYLIDGISSGLADTNEDGRVSIDELFVYAERRVRDKRPNQTPTLELQSRAGDIFIALTPQLDLLPPSKRIALLDRLEPNSERSLSLLTQALQDSSPDVVGKAIQLLRDKHREKGYAILAEYRPPNMVWIPPGRFVMGEGEEAHWVELEGYYIDKFPVTNAQYAVFVNATNRIPPTHWITGEIPEGSECHPVVYVSWYDAVEYAAWIGKRLPSDAEWEKAASWDPKTERKRRFPWGDEWHPEFCNDSERGVGDTLPVGSFSPRGDSAYGVAEMMGSIREWTCSLYRPFPYDPNDGKDDLNLKGKRVVRGKSWNRLTTWGRTAVEPQPGPMPNSYYRFRCALSF